LAWKDIVEYSFLGEFDLLRHSCADIRDDDWTKPAHREATVKYFRLQRAHEEIQRLNVEIRRLRTSIHDEGVKTTAVINQLLESDPKVALELRQWWQGHAAVNAVHIFRLDQIEMQPMFSGRRGIGVRLASPSVSQHNLHLQATVSSSDSGM
jgi:hypothetical protein